MRIIFIPVLGVLAALAPSFCFAQIGAEWNPTGNPIGGGPGYSDSVRHQDADYYVCTKTELLNAIASATSGDIIYVADSVEIDLTGTERYFLPGHVTLASGRGRVLGDTISWGGLLYTNDVNDNSLELLMMSGKGVRITGLRVRGPYWYREGRPDVDTFSLSNSSYGVQAWQDSFVVDNCEFWGWSHSCIYSANSKGFLVHHNFMRDGQLCQQGMGCCTGPTGDGIYEANLFDYCRDNIASAGDTSQSWEARWNIFLEHSVSHRFDRHGWPTQGEWAGKNTIIHHNTDRDKSPNSNSVRIRGKPAMACSVYGNWFYLPDSQSAVIFWNDTNCHMFDNQFTTSPPPGVSQRLPVAVASANTDSGVVPLNVNFTSNNSYDPDGQILWCEWDLGDNAAIIRKHSTDYSYDDIGIYVAELTIHDDHGIPSSDTVHIKVTPAALDSHYISVWVNDRYHGVDTGYFFKQVLVNNNLVWEDDVAGCEGWMHIVENITDLVGSQDSVTVTLRLRCRKSYSPSTIVEIETYWDDVALFWGDLKNGDFESVSNWNYYETQAYFQGEYDNDDARSGTNGYKLFFWTDHNCAVGDYGQISQKIAMGELGISYNNQEIKSCSLACTYPNPATHGSYISYVLPAVNSVSMTIYDACGRLVRSLVRQEQNPGEYTVLWDGNDTQGRAVASGVYFCNFIAGDFEETKQIVWLR